MVEPKTHRIEPERGILWIDATRRRQLRAILEFVRDIHVHIDPDMYRIDAGRLRATLQSLAGDGLEATQIAVTYQDLLLLEFTIDAAETYSQRRGFTPVDGVDDEDFAELHDWLAREETALFRRPPTTH